MQSIVTSGDASHQTRAKAMYCLSSTLKHSEPAVERFVELDGWKTLTQTLQGERDTPAASFSCASCCPSRAAREMLTPFVNLTDPSLKLRAKTAFLLSQLATQTTSPSTFLSQLRAASTLSTLVDSLSPSTAVPTGSSGSQGSVDPDLRDKGIRFLANVVERTSAQQEGFTSEEKEQIRRVVHEVEAEDGWTPEEVGMLADEWAAFKRQLA